MRHNAALHHDVVVLDDGDTAAVPFHVASVVVLGLDHVAADHLRVLDLDVRIVEYKVVIIYILYNLNRLLVILILLAFGLGAAAASCMRAVHAHFSGMAHREVVHPLVRVGIPGVAHVRPVLVVGRALLACRPLWSHVFDVTVALAH